MTQEALKLALEALERLRPEGFFNEAITAIKEALREHAMREVQRLGQEIEQEPVAWINVEERKLEWAKPMSWNTPTTVNIPKIPLYTPPPQQEERNFCQRCGKRTKDIHTCTPPQRTWVGLTESERRLINFQWQDGNGTAPEIIDLVEAKLKQKNGYAEEKNNA